MSAEDGEANTEETIPTTDSEMNDLELQSELPNENEEAESPKKEEITEEEVEPRPAQVRQVRVSSKTADLNLEIRQNEVKSVNERLLIVLFIYHRFNYHHLPSENFQLFECEVF